MRRSDSSEFYKGKRKKTGPAFLISIVILSIIAFVVLLFYGLQKYLVISNEGITLDIPLLREDSVDDSGNKTYKEVDAELTIGDYDYSNVKATAGEGLVAVNASYVPAEKITDEALTGYASSLGAGKGLVLEVKPASGLLVWNSQTDIALGYGTAGEIDLASHVAAMKDKGIYLVASVSCLADNMIASRYPQTMLMHSNGAIYTDDVGSWIDPHNTAYTEYIIDLCKELSDMGFDEILLTNVRLPSEANGDFMYGTQTASTPTPVTAVSGFALDIARGLKREDVVLSVRLHSDTALSSGKDSANGQDLALFYKIFDRVYCGCTYSGAPSTLETAKQYISVGDPAMRFVPIVYSAAPETSCWVVTTG